MSKLQSLKAAQKISDLAPLLNFKASYIAYFARKLQPAEKYNTFQILKKSGGVRNISAPINGLKQLQRALADLLTDCQLEIEAMNKPRRSLSHGFRKNHSIITNARGHTGRRFVLNLDLQDFFPSCNFGRVRGFFLKHREFGLSPEIATVLAQIACHGHFLPQGSPCSPIISDLIAHILDVRLAQLARLNHATYTRYADDLTFSTNEKVFPKSLASADPNDPVKWNIGKTLEGEIVRAGFAINQSKTRMQYRMSLQQVTGLTVNKKVNVRASYYRNARAMCNAIFRKGVYQVDGVPLTSIAKLEGIINHVHHVKRTVASWNLSADEKTPAEKPDSAIRRLYCRLLFYKYFVQLSQPLVVCEGKTDSVYLRAAIRSLAAAFPSLSTPPPNSKGLGVAFFRYHGLSSDLLELEGGTGQLTHWIAHYDTSFRSYNVNPGHAVVVVLDSDSGATPVLKLAKAKFKKTISLDSTALFHHLCRNLYLVFTPMTATANASRIEDFFEKSVLDEKLGGKSFNATNFDNSSTEYGKFFFAQYVVKPKAKSLNLSGFSPLLVRIQAACSDYATKILQDTART